MVLRENKRRLCDFCDRHLEELRWTHPSGSSTAFVKIVGGLTMSSSASASGYAREVASGYVRVSVIPSTLFVDARDGHVHVTYATVGGTRGS